MVVLLVMLLLCTPPRVVDAQPSSPWYALEDGSRVDFERARRAHRRVRSPGPHPGRLAIEQITTLALGSTWYWVYKDINATDWDLEPTWHEFGRRFWDPAVFRFDTNRFFVNEAHILAGSIHYAIPRLNGFGPFASLGVGILTSAAWEWVFEYREYISINDLVVSPYGGQPLGETFFALGELYDREKRSLSLAARVLTYPFSRGQAFHRALGDESPRFPDGLGSPMSHDFRADVGVALVSGAPTAASRLDLGVADLPGYRRDGRFHTFFRDANFTSLRVDVLAGASGLNRVTATARTELAGLHAQSRLGDGWAVRAGFGRGVWLDHRPRGEHLDQVGVVDVAGVVASLDLWRGPWHAELGVAGYGDFGSVSSLAYAAVQDQLMPATLRSELEEQGTYFAWGGTLVPRVRIDAGRWVSVTGRVDQSWFAGLAGPDRVHHNAIPRRVRLRDRRRVAEAELTAHLSDVVGVGVRVADYRRASALDETRAALATTELGLWLGARF